MCAAHLPVESVKSGRNLPGKVFGAVRGNHGHLGRLHEIFDMLDSTGELPTQSSKHPSQVAPKSRKMDWRTSDRRPRSAPVGPNRERNDAAFPKIMKAYGSPRRSLASPKPMVGASTPCQASDREYQHSPRSARPVSNAASVSSKADSAPSQKSLCRSLVSPRAGTPRRDVSIERDGDKMTTPNPLSSSEERPDTEVGCFSPRPQSPSATKGMRQPAGPAVSSTRQLEVEQGGMSLNASRVQQAQVAQEVPAKAFRPLGQKAVQAAAAAARARAAAKWQASMSPAKIIGENMKKTHFNLSDIPPDALSRARSMESTYRRLFTWNEGHLKLNPRTNFTLANLPTAIA